jgi:hypothetical protein
MAGSPGWSRYLRLWQSSCQQKNRNAVDPIFLGGGPDNLTSPPRFPSDRPLRRIFIPLEKLIGLDAMNGTPALIGDNGLGHKQVVVRAIAFKK